MTLSLIKRLVKGSALTATEHDSNLTAIENAVNAGSSSGSLGGNVVAFGADPTGATDSSTAFQSAFDTVVGDLLIPPGTYIINTGTILSNASGKKTKVTRVYGSVQNTIIDFRNAGVSTDTEGNCKCGWLSVATVAGNENTGLAPFMIQGLTFRGPHYGCAIFLANGAQHHIDNCYFAPDNNPQWHVIFDCNNGGEIMRTTFNMNSATKAGVRWYNTGRTGVVVPGGTGYFNDGYSISRNCGFTGGGGGTYLSYYGTTAHGPLNIWGNTFSAAGGDGTIGILSGLSASTHCVNNWFESITTCLICDRWSWGLRYELNSHYAVSYGVRILSSATGPHGTIGRGNRWDSMAAGAKAWSHESGGGNTFVVEDEQIDNTQYNDSWGISRSGGRRINGATAGATNPSVFLADTLVLQSTSAVTLTGLADMLPNQRVAIVGDGFTTFPNNVNNMFTNTGANISPLLANRVYVAFKANGKIYLNT